MPLVLGTSLPKRFRIIVALMEVSGTMRLLTHSEDGRSRDRRAGPPRLAAHAARLAPCRCLAVGSHCAAPACRPSRSGSSQMFSVCPTMRQFGAVLLFTHWTP